MRTMARSDCLSGGSAAAAAAILTKRPPKMQTNEKLCYFHKRNRLPFILYQKCQLKKLHTRRQDLSVDGRIRNTIICMRIHKIGYIISQRLLPPHNIPNIVAFLECVRFVEKFVNKIWLDFPSLFCVFSAKELFIWLTNFGCMPSYSNHYYDICVPWWMMEGTASWPMCVDAATAKTRSAVMFSHGWSDSHGTTRPNSTTFDDLHIQALRIDARFNIFHSRLSLSHRWMSNSQ